MKQICLWYLHTLSFFSKWPKWKVVYLPREVISLYSLSKDAHSSWNVAPLRGRTNKVTNGMVQLTFQCTEDSIIYSLQQVTFLWLFMRRKATMLVLITALQFAESNDKKVDTAFRYEGPGEILSSTILSLRYFSTELYQQQLHLSWDTLF